MDLNNYISSGILERYVLGDVSKQELQEVECMSHIYPEIEHELLEMQKGIENLALKLAKDPAPHVKAKILTAIKDTLQVPDEVEVDTGTVIAMQPKKQPGQFLGKLWAAASILIIIGLSTLGYSWYTSAEQANSELATANTTILELEDEKNTLDVNYADAADQLAFVSAASTEKVIMPGTEKYPSDYATVFWDQSTERVLLDAEKMPSNGTDESYQLWALIDGNPKSMGVFEKDDTTNQRQLLIEMERTDLADAFAITAEPKGGSESPTLANLRVIGTIG